MNTFTAPQKAAAPLFGSVGGGIVVSTYADWIDSITATIPAAVVGRHIFYNESGFDDNTALIDPSDETAIATDKSAYLPGSGVVTPSSVTSYSKGINGIFVDIANSSGTLTLGDFEFDMSELESAANNTPSTWVSAPVPTAFTVLTDTPSVGTDRVEFIWAAGAIENRYLEVTVKGNDVAGGFNSNTGLAASDIFYFGNIVGDTFVDTPSGVFLTTSADEIEIQTQVISAAAITSIWDMDRNGVHLASDRIVTRANTITALNRIDISSPPAAPATAPARAIESRSGLDLARTLSIPNLSGPPESPASISAREWTTDTSSGPITSVFQPVREADRPRALARFEATDEAVESLGLDDALLDRLVATLLP